MIVKDGLTDGGTPSRGANTGTVEEITSGNGGTDITITNGANENGEDLKTVIDGVTGKDGGGALKITTGEAGGTDMTDGTEDGRQMTRMIFGTTSGGMNGIHAVQSRDHGGRGTDRMGATNANDLTSEEMTGRSDMDRRLGVANWGAFLPMGL